MGYFNYIKRQGQNIARLFGGSMIRIQYFDDIGFVAMLDGDVLTSKEFTDATNELLEDYMGDVHIFYSRENKINYRDVSVNAQRKNKIKSGYIYVLQWQGYYKIGMTSRTPNERLTEISPKMPTEPKLIYYYSHLDIVKEEKHLHDLFESCKSNGEWFKLSDGDLEYIMGTHE